MFFSLYLLLLSSLFSPFFSSFNNPKCMGARYLCGANNAPDVCVNISDSRGQVHYLQTCPTSFYCPISNTTNATTNSIGNITCASIPVGNINTLPGEYCNHNQDCYNVSCINGICQGSQGLCYSHSDCDPGLFCNMSGTAPYSCVPQVAFGEVVFFFKELFLKDNKTELFQFI